MESSGKLVATSGQSETGALAFRLALCLLSLRWDLAGMCESRHRVSQVLLDWIQGLPRTNAQLLQSLPFCVQHVTSTMSVMDRMSDEVAEMDAASTSLEDCSLSPGLPRVVARASVRTQASGAWVGRPLSRGACCEC